MEHVRRHSKIRLSKNLIFLPLYPCFTPQQVEHVRRHSKPQAEANSGKGRPPLMLNSMNSMKNHQFHFRSIQGASNQREPSPLPAEQHIQVETRKGVGASP